MPFNKTTDLDHKKRVGTLSLYFIGGFAVALALLTTTTHIGYENCVHKISVDSRYKFITPDVSCEVVDKFSANYDHALKTKLQSYIDMPGTRKLTQHVSVYYYNFSTRKWFGVNENEKFYPASLLKLPVVITLMREAEVFPHLLLKKVTYEGVDLGLVQHFSSGDVLRVGETYTLSQLAEKSIKYSNNEAAYVLAGTLGRKNVAYTYDDIGLPFPGPLGVDFISVRDYSAFFKVLYKSSYLSRTSSEAVLDLLTQTTFTSGIVAGVPESVKVAHKYGERMDPEKDDALQLHDCGIVYAPQEPFLLCVMTRGDTFSDLAEIIKHVTEIVYKEVTK